MSYDEKMAELLGGMLDLLTGVGPFRNLLGVIALLVLFRLRRRVTVMLIAFAVKGFSFLVIYKPRSGLLRVVLKVNGSGRWVWLNIYFKTK